MSSGKLFLLCLTPPTEGFPWDDLRKILPKGHRWPRYQMAEKHCRKFQSSEYRAHERYRETDDRQTTDDRRRHIANMNLSSRSLKTDVTTEISEKFFNALLGTYHIHLLQYNIAKV